MKPTNTCIVCERVFDEDDGSVEYDDKRKDNSQDLAFVCCDQETIMENGKPTGLHDRGVCTHCCPDHGSITKAWHIHEACEICIRDKAAG